MYRKYLLLSGILVLFGCRLSVSQVIPGADRPDEYLPLMEGKTVGLVAHHASQTASGHLVDALLKDGVHLVKIFTPEHGFRGDQADGTLVGDTIDAGSGLPVVSLYGKKRKPAPADLAGLDLVAFDLQDVGVRCYTYLSTLYLVMQACAENNVPLLLLDRPNPNGYFVDGPMLDPGKESFVGIIPVPFVHGMTLGELAGMINGEGWLGDSLQCSLRVIPCLNYTHKSYYQLPVPPSPNLPNMEAVYLYPSLVFFEGTVISVGRGTDYPFQVFGHPDFADYPMTFTPRSIPGVSDHPLYEGRECHGVDLRGVPGTFLHDQAGIILDWLIAAWEEYGKKESFFTPYFDQLAGTDQLRKMVMEGKDKYQIKWAWKKDLDAFMERRKPYLLYSE